MQSDAATTVPSFLTSWKEIAQYMGKGVRTVQRWEQSLDLPVRRPLGNGYKSAVVARPADLDEWLVSRWGRRGEGDLQISMPEFGGGRLSDVIKVSQQLRAEHRELLTKLTLELQMLVQTCRYMEAAPIGN